MLNGNCLWWMLNTSKPLQQIVMLIFPITWFTWSAGHWGTENQPHGILTTATPQAGAPLHATCRCVSAFKRSAAASVLLSPAWNWPRVGGWLMASQKGWWENRNEISITGGPNLGFINQPSDGMANEDQWWFMRKFYPGWGQVMLVDGGWWWSTMGSNTTWFE